MKETKRVTFRKNPNLQDIEMERAKLFNGLPLEEKWNRLIKLILLSRNMTNKAARKPNKITFTKKGILYNY